eukprot:4461831-Prymnesium_polylepis.1
MIVQCEITSKPVLWEYYLPQVVLVDISCGSACLAQVSGPMWAVAPSTEHTRVKHTKDHPKWPTGAQMAAEN